MIFAVRSDLIEVCRDEDGSSIEGLTFYVVAENEKGQRWAHFRSFLNGTKRFDHEEGVWFFRRDEGHAEQSAERLCRFIRDAVSKGQPLDFEYWTEIDPAYGSAAYQNLDDGYYFRDREIIEARDRGEHGAFQVELKGFHFG